MRLFYKLCCSIQKVNLCTFFCAILFAKIAHERRRLREKEKSPLALPHEKPKKVSFTLFQLSAEFCFPSLTFNKLLFPEILKANMIQPTLCVFVYERQARAGMFEDKGSLVHSGALSSLHSSFVYSVNSPTSSILHCLSLSFSVSLPLVTHSFSTRSVIRVYTLATFYSPH